MEALNRDYAISKIKALEEMCACRPTSTMLGDLGSCYFTAGEPQRALPLLETAWAKNKTSGLGVNLAMILKDLGRHAESLRVIEEAFWLSDKDDFYCRLGYAEALLRAGFWRQAWPLYSNARPTQQGAALEVRLPKHIKEWFGAPIHPQQTLLVLNEGGLGDRISYPRYLLELTKLGIKWKFHPSASLYPIFERIFPRENLVFDGDDIVADFWCTAFSLPEKLDTMYTQQPPPLRLAPTPESIAKYKFARPDNIPIVGLCYAAAELYQGDRKVRSLTEGQAMRLVSLTADKVRWVSLQHGTKLPIPVTNIYFDTWDDTMGLISNLDAVVSVDTGVMHVAGALDKPMAVLLSGNSCWKFGTKKSKIPLYPNATFYRNEVCGLEHAIDLLITTIRNGTAW